MTDKTAYFLMYGKQLGGVRYEKTNSACTIIDPPKEGKCSILMSQTDVNTKGNFDGYVKVVHSTGNDQIFPSNGSFKILISEL